MCAKSAGNSAADKITLGTISLFRPPGNKICRVNQDHFISSTNGEKFWKIWPWRDLNTQPSDLESDALPLRHRVVAKCSNRDQDDAL